MLFQDPDFRSPGRLASTFHVRPCLSQARSQFSFSSISCRACSWVQPRGQHKNTGVRLAVTKSEKDIIAFASCGCITTRYPCQEVSFYPFQCCRRKIFLPEDVIALQISTSPWVKWVKSALGLIPTGPASFRLWPSSWCLKVSKRVGQVGQIV